MWDWLLNLPPSFWNCIPAGFVHVWVCFIGVRQLSGVPGLTRAEVWDARWTDCPRAVALCMFVLANSPPGGYCVGKRIPPTHCGQLAKSVPTTLRKGMWVCGIKTRIWCDFRMLFHGGRFLCVFCTETMDTDYSHPEFWLWTSSKVRSSANLSTSSLLYYPEQMCCCLQCASFPGTTLRGLSSERECIEFNEFIFVPFPSPTFPWIPLFQWKSRWCVMRKLSPVAGKC